MESIKLGRLYRAILSIALLSSASAHAGQSLFLPNVNATATGTSLGGGHYGLDISGTITASSPSVGPTGSAVPADGDYIAGSKAGILTGLLIGQQTMANSLACVLPSDQSAIPVTGTFWQATQPVSAASLPLPTGAATSALQTTGNSALTTINTTLGTPFQAGGSIGNTSFGATQATAASLNATVVTTGGATIAKDSSLTTINTTLGSPFQAGGSIGNTTFASTQSGTWNITNVSGTVSLPTGAATSALQTTGNTSLATIATNTGKAPINTTGSGSAAGATVSTVITLSAPANAVGFILMNLDTSTANVRWAVGRTATTTLGQQLQPGRDTGFVPVGANVSLVAESGTQNYDIQWVSQ